MGVCVWGEIIEHLEVLNTHTANITNLTTTATQKHQTTPQANEINVSKIVSVNSSV